MIFQDAQEKEHFYSAAIKSRIQLLWMQNTAMRIFLWLVTCINFIAPTCIFIGWLIVEDSGKVYANSAPPIVVASVFLPFVLLFFSAIYAAGLLVYRWRVRRAALKRSTVVPIYEMTLDPIETAALISRTNYRAEMWYMIYRLVDTGVLRLVKQNDAEITLCRTSHDTQLTNLKWYELRLLDDIFPSEQVGREKLLRSMSPERLAVLKGVNYAVDVPLNTVYKYIGSFYLSDLNKDIRAQIVNGEHYRRMDELGMWTHTFLYALIITTPFFGVIFAPAMIASLPWHDIALQFSPLITALACLAYVGAIVLSMIWFLGTDIFTRFGLEKYVEAEGLYMYLDVALQDRLQNNGLGERETAYFMPYAQVMGVVEVNDEDEARRLTESVFKY